VHNLDVNVADDETSLAQLIERASAVLPEQGPLPAFVHHNTLHHFEHLKFSEGVIAAARLFGSEPYQSEHAFGQHLKSGRIQRRDIEAVLQAEPGEWDSALFARGPTVRQFRSFRLTHVFELPRAQALNWTLHEEAALSRFSSLVTSQRRAELEHAALGRFVDSDEPRGAFLRRLWDTLAQETQAPNESNSTGLVRPRDCLFARFGVDTDQTVHPRLIRFTAAFLDQGLAYWSMPGREHGMLHAFRALYGQGGAPPDVAFAGLSEVLRLQQREGWDAQRTIRWALTQAGVQRKHWGVVLERTLFSLRGWGGMVRQFELRPEWAPVTALPARLADYLAIQLLLDWISAKNLLASHPTQVFEPSATPTLPNPLVYEAFVLAQLSSVPPVEFLEPTNAHAWLAAVRTFNDVERRRLWHLAYERRHRIMVLDALCARAPTPVTRVRTSPPTYQLVFCIDDREESLRRHLEETLPDAETLGFAGFFSVAMQYQGLQDVRPRALCPVVVTARHLVREVAVDGQAQQTYARSRATRARTEHAWTVGSRTLVRGGLLTTGLGLAMLVPLVGRSLFPHLTGKWLASPNTVPQTRLQIQGNGEHDPDTGFLVGFTIDEMTDIVASSLRTLAIASRLSPLVVVVGHGSSSLNNPHQAAYDCGATGGGRGGPNARAFAAMANHAGVRAELAKRGFAVPVETYFIGGYHNTADDSMTYYDEDLVPEAHVAAYAHLKDKLRQACALDAHERSRRFVNVPLDITPHEAIACVQARSTDLAQPRPECGHATNAVCIVGRRERTRGVFLDRRAFLVSYDPTTDPTEEILGDLLQAVGPVGAGINLEYYFSYVDPKHYGCGSKLPHNITGLIGVMDGHASDLRTGLPWQMVELHEPVRLLTIVEAKCDTLARLLEKRPALAELIRNEWIIVVAWDPDSDDLFLFEHGTFKPYIPERSQVASFPRSSDVYGGKRQHLPVVRVVGGEA
jgi:uncharacterized protein